MNVAPPVYIDDTSSYSFFLTDAPSLRYSLSWPPLDAPLEFYVQTDTNLFQSNLAELAKDFLEKTSDYFTTPLSLQSFTKELQHRWIDPYGLLREPRDPLCCSVQVQWTPIQLFLGVESYTIVWALHGLDPGEDIVMQVPEQRPSQMPEQRPSQMPEQGPSQMPSIPVPETTPATESDLEPFDLSELSYIEGELSGPSSTLRARDRRIIRETRLRAEMLQLRAERLAQRYLEKYATAEESDTESVLSFPSDTE